MKSIAFLGIKGLPSKGGGERVAEAIINRAIREGYTLYVYGKESYCKNLEIKRNLHIIRIKDIGGKYLNPFLFGLFSALHAVIFRNYDLIHLHYADFGFLLPILRLKYKVISTSHGAEYYRDKWSNVAKTFFKIVERPFVKFSNTVTCVSSSLTEYYRKKYKKEVIFIPNGIIIDNDNRFDKAGKLKIYNDSIIKQKYNLVSHDYILFSAGRIIPSKGCDILLKANQKLKEKLTLIIVGKIEDRKYLMYLKNLALSNVIFIDFIEDKEELYSLISNALFFVFPSTYEAMSMMLLEVASLKKLIICSDIRENYDAIGNNAIFFKSGDYTDLARKIEFVLTHKEKLSHLGYKAYMWVKKNRNWEYITSEYIKLYNNLI